MDETQVNASFQTLLGLLNNANASIAQLAGQVAGLQAQLKAKEEVVQE